MLFGRTVIEDFSNAALQHFIYFFAWLEKDQVMEVLPFAPTPPPRHLSGAELQKARHDEENTMRELRIFLRDVNAKLFQDRRFKEFTKPVDLIEVYIKSKHSEISKFDYQNIINSLSQETSLFV